MATKTMDELAPPDLIPGTRAYEDWWSAYLREHREGENRQYSTRDPEWPAPGIAPERDPELPPTGFRDPRTWETTRPDLSASDAAPSDPNRTGGSDAYGTTPYTDRGSGSGAEGWRYGGFDFGQDPNNRLIGKSAKYTLAEATRLAKAAGATDSWKTKEGAAEFANQWIKPFYEKHGFEVLEIAGEKMKVRDHADRAAGREGSWIDWVVNAGGANPEIAFQVEQSQEAFGAPETYVPQGFAPTQGGPPIKGAPLRSGQQDPNMVRPQVQDRYGRSPNHPNYGLPPQPGETGLIDTRTGAPVAINPNAYAPLVPSMNELAYPELPLP